MLSSKRYPRRGAPGSWKPRLRKPSDSPKFTELVRNRARILITIRLNPKPVSFQTTDTSITLMAASLPTSFSKRALFGALYTRNSLKPYPNVMK